MLTYIIAHVSALGGSAAFTISYAEHKSVSWAILHGLCGWFYPLYRWMAK